MSQPHSARGRWAAGAALACGVLLLGAIHLMAGASGDGRAVAGPVGLARPAARPAPPAWRLVAPFIGPYYEGIGLQATTTGPDGLLYALGGSEDGLDCSFGYSGSGGLALAYAPETDTWTAIADLPGPRDLLAAVTGADGRVYAIGGDYGAGSYQCTTPSPAVEAYTPATHTWTTAARLPQAASDLAAASAPNGRIYVLGGWDHQALSTVQMYTPAANTWTLAARLPTARYDLAAALGADGRVYAIGGITTGGNWLTTVEAYTSKANTWTTVARLPAAGQYPVAAAAPDGRIYVVVNATGSIPNAVWAYSPAANTWSAVAPTAKARNFGAAATGPDGRVFLIGGCCDQNGSWTGTTQAYGPAVVLLPQFGLPGTRETITGGNFAANATVRAYWGTVATGTLLGTGKTTGAGALAGSIGFAVPSGVKTGATYTVTVQDDVSRYPVLATLIVQRAPTPTATNTPTHTDTPTPTGTATALPPRWNPAPALNASVYDMAVTAGLDGRIYAMGGFDGGYYVNSVEVYQPGASTWTFLAPLSAALIGAGAATGGDGRIYIAGGGNSTIGAMTTLAAYTPATSTWTLLAPMPTARRDLSLVTGPDGRLYALGGRDVAGDPLNMVEAYTPATNTWMVVAHLPTARYGQAAVTGPDGRIYVIGGTADPSGYTCSQCAAVEAYTVGANTWTAVASLPSGRAYLGAAVGADGRIYAIGGFGGQTGCGACGNTVAVYNPHTNTWTSAVPLTAARTNFGAATGSDGRIYAVAGSNGGILSSVEAYGPVVTLSPTSGTAGATLTLSSTQFAPSATVSVYWGTTATGTLLATGATTARGQLTAPLTVTIPAKLKLGTYRISAVDSRSGYPAWLYYDVTSAPAYDGRAVFARRPS